MVEKIKAAKLIKGGKKNSLCPYNKQTTTTTTVFLYCRF